MMKNRRGQSRRGGISPEGGGRIEERKGRYSYSADSGGAFAVRAGEPGLELLAEAGALESENARLTAQGDSAAEQEATERLAQERLGLSSGGEDTEGSNQQLYTGG